MDGSKITPSILGLRSSGSCVSSRSNIWMHLELVLSGVKSVTVDFGAEIKASYLQVDAYISQVIGNHGLFGPVAQTMISSA